MHIDDKRSIVEAKQNEIEIKNLGSFYGNPDAEEIEDAYPEDLIKVEEYLEMAEYLEVSPNPEHIRLAKYLREISKVHNVTYEKAKTLLKKEEYRTKPLKDKTVKTIIKEFNKIEKRNKKLERSKAMSLNWFRDVKEFINDHLGKIVKNIRRKNFDMESPAGREELSNYLTSLKELQFLQTSKLTRKVR